jgi:hypothetical protein
MGRRPLLRRLAIARPSLCPSPANQKQLYAVLALLSERYPPSKGRLSTCYAPVRHFQGCPLSCDLHVLGAPLTFALSQDQTLQLQTGELSVARSIPTLSILRRCLHRGRSHLTKTRLSLALRDISRAERVTPIQFSRVELEHLSDFRQTGDFRRRLISRWPLSSSLRPAVNPLSRFSFGPKLSRADQVLAHQAGQPELHLR